VTHAPHFSPNVIQFVTNTHSNIVDKDFGIKTKTPFEFPDSQSRIVVLYNQKSMGINLHDENLFSTKKTL
jgi:hypothetical protein